MSLGSVHHDAHDARNLSVCDAHGPIIDIVVTRTTHNRVTESNVGQVYILSRQYPLVDGRPTPRAGKIIIDHLTPGGAEVKSGDAGVLRVEMCDTHVGV